MPRSALLFACLWAGTAAAQQPEFRLLPPAPRPQVDATPRILEPARPNTRPDTTLLDDTRAGGLESRPAHAQPEDLKHRNSEFLEKLRELKRQNGKDPAEGARQLRPLPMGSPCIVETMQGKEYAGVLEEAGRWIVLRLDDGRRVWIAARRVVAVIEAGDSESNPENFRSDAAPQQ